jgi:hypothetical protein
LISSHSVISVEFRLDILCLPKLASSLELFAPYKIKHKLIEKYMLYKLMDSTGYWYASVILVIVQREREREY